MSSSVGVSVIHDTRTETFAAGASTFSLAQPEFLSSNSSFMYHPNGSLSLSDKGLALSVRPIMLGASAFLFRLAFFCGLLLVGGLHAAAAARCAALVGAGRSALRGLQFALQ